MDQQFNLEEDINRCTEMLNKIRGSKIYAQNLYAALCNNDYQKQDTWEVLKNHSWGCSWRGSGGIVARLAREGDYMDWYCSGIMHDDKGLAHPSYVSEGTITEEIKQDLLKLGWAWISD